MGKKDNQSDSKNQINHSKSVYKTVNSFSSNVTGGKDFKLLTELKCVYTNADSFMNKFDEFRTRFINDESDPHIIMIAEVLPKNSRYSTSKAEFNLEGYDLFPEKFPIQDTRGILVYITGTWGMDFVSSSPLFSTTPLFSKFSYKSFLFQNFHNHSFFLHLTISVDVIHHE